jgi:NADPH:quinone reductase-like Zn-dependent oxidoreductase
MIGIGVRTSGGALEILDLPEPREPHTGELVVDIIAAGIGPWDALLHTGGWDVDLEPPAALGVEGAGRVAATGSGETQFNVGDLVLVHEAPLSGGSGTWAQKVLVRTANTARLPENLAPVLAAALPVAGLTARQTLDELHVGAGTRLLVVGASGPTASIAVQLARRRGAEIVAGASAAHADRLRSLGASDVIDTHVAGWAQRIGRRFDAVFNAATGTSADAIGLLVDGGRLTSITLDAPGSVRGITTNDLYVQPDGRALGELATLATAGELCIDVQTTPLAEAIVTAEQVAAGRSGGIKHVIELTQDGRMRA